MSVNTLTKLFFLATATLLTTSCQHSQTTDPDAQSIVILFDNDVHCGIEGYPYLAGLRDAVADTAQVAIVSSGDYLQGGLVGALSHGEYIVDVMREVGYDAVTLGNHEFDYGMPHLRELIERLQVPVTCVNLYNTADERVFLPYVIKQVGSRRIAFIGATTPTTMQTEAYSFYDEDDVQLYDLRPQDVYQLVQEAVDEARNEQQADYVILITHLGEDPNYLNVDSHGLIQSTTGIDAVLDAHTHSVIASDAVPNRNGEPVLIAQTGTKFQNIGKLVILPDGSKSIGLVPTSEFTRVNDRVKQVTDSVLDLLDKIVSRPVCHSDVPLVILDAEGRQAVRVSETNAGDLVTDAYRTFTGADCALTNGGGIRTQIEAGDLTYGSMVDLLPYDNYVSVVEVTGAQLQQLLSACTADLPVENGDFPQASGLTYTVQVNRAGKPDHIRDLQIRNHLTGRYEPVKANKTYELATIDYCITGGGFKGILKKNKVLRENIIIYNECLIKYVTENLEGHIGDEYAKPQGRIKIVY